MRRLAVLLATAALAVGVAAPAHAVTPAKYQQQAFTATNANRAAQGLKELKADDCLQHAATRQARIMASRQEMFHQDIGKVLKDCGLSTVGENVAYGYASGKAVVNDGWMHSEGHRANILNPSYRLMGLGARLGRDGRWYVAQVFGAKG